MKKKKLNYITLPPNLPVRNGDKWGQRAKEAFKQNFERDEFNGNTALEVLESMRQSNMFSEQYEMSDYIDSLVESAERLHNISFVVPEGSLEDRAEAILAEMVTHNLIEIS